jgi:serine/threonine-protein kinase
MDLRERLQAALAGTYTIDRELGGGGMSRVFLAIEPALGRRVVVKILPPDAAAQVSVDRFQREISLAAQLQQAHIVPLLSAGNADGLPYYTMPFVEGESLRARLARERELPIGEAISILREIARALGYAHQRGVVHRDIKPDNVLLSAGSAMVTDFGVAKALTASTNAESSELTSLGVALGTPAYMAPEQASADPMIDHRADIYAFGALAYELLTGQSPFAGRPPQAMLAAHLSEAPEPVDRRREGMPPALAQLIMRCLAKRPADRPQNATEIVQTLDAVGTPGSGMLPAAGLSSSPRLTGNWSRMNRQAIAALVLVALVGGVFAVWRQRAAMAPVDKSIAVLPLTSVGSTTGDEAFRDGMTTEITNALGKVPGLSVKAAGLVKAKWKPESDVLQLGQSLGVSSLLQASAQRVGDSVRITAQLINVSTGFTQWSEKYDEDFKDIFAVQDRIARAIAAELRVRLASGTSASIVRAATANTEAHSLYLQGIYLWNKRTYQNINQAIALFDSAIARDPRYVQPRAGIAMAYAVLPTFADMNNGDAFRKAVAAAAEALRMDDASTEAHAALGFAYLGLYRNADAERELRYAIELDSTFATAHQWLSLVLTRTGRFDEAIREGAHAHALDPLSRVIQTTRSGALMQARRFVEAESVSRQVIAFDPTYANGDRTLTLTLIAQHRYAEAVEAASRFLEKSGERLSLGVAQLALAYTMNSQSSKARELLAELADRSRRGQVCSAMIAAVYDALGDRATALTWLERGVRDYDPFYNWSRGPAFDGLRSDPRGAALLAKVER